MTERRTPQRPLALWRALPLLLCLWGARAVAAPEVPPAPEAMPVVWVADVGLAPEAAALPPRAGGLLGRLRRAGFAPVALPLPDGPELAAVAHTLRDQITARLGERPFFAIGHGLGGTALAAAAPDLPGLRGWVGLGAPLGHGGATGAAQAWFAAVARAPQAGWPTWGAARFAGQPLSRLLMTRPGLRPDLRAAWLAQPVPPIPAALLAAVAAAQQGPTPQANAGLRGLAARPDVPVLAVMAVADGLWPVWQCDPVTLGLTRAAGEATVARRVLTRADGTPELGHLDLLIHPAALDHVHDPVVATLRGWVAAAAEAQALRGQ